MLNKLNNVHIKNLIYYLIPLLLIIIFIIISDPRTSTDTQRFIRWSRDMNLNIFVGLFALLPGLNCAALPPPPIKDANLLPALLLNVFIFD